MEIAVLWTYNGTSVIQKESILFTPSDLNHTLTITNASIADSGIYVCHAVVRGGMQLGQKINVSVIEGMYIQLRY